MVDVVLTGKCYYNATVLVYLALSANIRKGTASNKHKIVNALGRYYKLRSKYAKPNKHNKPYLNNKLLIIIANISNYQWVLVFFTIFHIT